MAQPDPGNVPKQQTLARIGELLLWRGLLKKEELAKAISIQRREKEMQKLPLGQILIEMGALTEPQLEGILEHPELRKEIGALALEKKLIDQKILDDCLSVKKPDELIGQVLIRKGFLSVDEVGDLLKEQTASRKIGELALSLGVIGKKDFEAALQIQRSPRKLGEILCDLGFITPLDLNQVLTKYNKQLSIGDMLVSLGYITEEQRQLSINEMSQGMETLEEVLLRRHIISRKQYQTALSKQYNVPFEDLSGFEYGEKEKKNLISIIGQKYAEKNMVLPISFNKNLLKLALCNPEEMVHVLYELKSMYAHYDISCVLIAREKFEELFEVLYSEHLGVAPGKNSPEDGDIEIDIMELNLKEEIGRAEDKVSPYGATDVEAEELMNYVIKYGIIHKASDIHIEQDRAGVRLRYRIDGMMREIPVGWLKEKLKQKVASVISRIKVVSNLDIAEKRLPQDGVFRLNYYDREKGQRLDLDFRVATCRASVGENVTIRILDPRNANVGLDKLNHSPHVLDHFKTYLKSPSGMILVCGPTGSGKSSTLYAALQHIYSPRIKIITAEDPIEYNFPGIMQTQINLKINLTFSRLLRSFLRLDPDVILVGEMRDEETAKIGFDAAQTGHLILSTLHTNDAVSAISRLLDLKVEYGQIASSLMCVIAQRLLRKICDSCKEETVPGDEEWNVLFRKYPSHIRFFKGRGCEACNQTGYRGRTLISEIFAVDSEISHALNKGYDEDQITRLALESGMKTMLEDGLSKTDQTTLSEIIRMIPHEMVKRFRSRNRAQVTTDSLIENLMAGKGIAQDETSSATFHLSNPETERGIIDLMKSKYEDLAAPMVGSRQTYHSGLFREFIADNFYEICEKYKCKRIMFNISPNKENSRVEISAVPVL